MKSEQDIFKEALTLEVEVANGPLDVFWRHHELVRRWDRVHNLSAVRSSAEAARLHYADCLLAASMLKAVPDSVTDVGSGAGFPGLVWAVLWPKTEVRLVDASRKRCSFLQEAVRVLELANVSVLHSRFEDTTTTGLVTSRATVSLEKQNYAPLLSAVEHSVALLVGHRPDAAEWMALVAEAGLQGAERRPYSVGGVERALVTAHR